MVFSSSVRRGGDINEHVRREPGEEDRAYGDENV